MPVFAIIAALASALDPPVTGTAPDWLEGHWCEGDADKRTDETWTSTEGGLVLGVHRDFEGDAATGFELMRIAREGESWTFHAQPNGAPPTRFALDDAGPTHLRFVDATNDFPKRVEYRRDGDALTAWIDDGEGGSRLSWRWTRCAD